MLAMGEKRAYFDSPCASNLRPPCKAVRSHTTCNLPDIYFSQGKSSMKKCRTLSLQLLAKCIESQGTHAALGEDTELGRQIDFAVLPGKYFPGRSQNRFGARRKADINKI
jgi:hypothetical protein